MKPSIIVIINSECSNCRIIFNVSPTYSERKYNISEIWLNWEEHIKYEEQLSTYVSLHNNEVSFLRRGLIIKSLILPSKIIDTDFYYKYMEHLPLLG